MKKRAIERKERRRRRGRQLERALPHNTHTYLGAISGPLSSFFFFFLSFHCSCSVSFSLSLSCHIQWVCWLAGWQARPSTSSSTPSALSPDPRIFTSVKGIFFSLLLLSSSPSSIPRFFPLSLHPPRLQLSSVRGGASKWFDACGIYI